jgi:hypothetical protein
MTDTALNVIVGQAQAYIAPALTAAPAFASSGLVTAPTTPWVAVGFTESGVTINQSRKTNDIMVEEQSTPILVTTESTDVSIDIGFAEDTMANILLAYGGGAVSTIAPTSTTPGLSSLVLSDTLNQLAICFTAVSAAGLGRLVYIPTMVSAGSVKTTYSRAKAKRSYTATFRSLCNVNQMTFQDATSAHS